MVASMAIRRCGNAMDPPGVVSGAVTDAVNLLLPLSGAVMVIDGRRNWPRTVQQTRRRDDHLQAQNRPIGNGKALPMQTWV